MLTLSINQQYAKIGLNIQKPKLELKTTLPSIELNIEAPQLSIDSPRPQLYIDQSQCFADAGLRGPADFASYCSNLATSAVAQSIDCRVSEGNLLAEINGVTIAQICADSAYQGEIECNVQAIPKQPPIIDWDIRPVNVELERGSVDLRLRRGTVEYNFQWGKVDAYIAQMNYLEINWVDNKVNKLM